MAVTTYKGYPLIATGAEVDNWGALANTDGWTVIDNNLAGVTTKSLTNVNVTLSASESQSAILNLTGTLTGAVQITTALKGFFFVNNATTGSFAVTITNGVAGVVAPQGLRTVMTSDATYGVKIAGSDTFPTGTRMLFQQTSAPTGWTKESNATYNDASPRLTTGSITTGGTALYSTSILASRTLVARNMPSLALEVTDPGHFHTTDNLATSTAGPDYQSGTGRNFNDVQSDTKTTGITVALGNTSRGGAQTALWDAIKFVDFIIAVKN
jgi:hypothetical protein